MRWESSDVGALLHVVPAPGTMALGMPDVLKIEEDAEKKYKSAIVFDVDYYTIAPTTGRNGVRRSGSRNPLT